MTTNQIKLSIEGQNKANQMLNRELESKFTSAITRYNFAGVVKKAGESAQQANIKEGIEEAWIRYPEAVRAGKHFIHDGCECSVQRTPLYDFSDNAAWQRKAARLDRLEEQYKLAKTQLKNLEQELIQQGTVTAYAVKEVLKTHLK